MNVARQWPLFGGVTFLLALTALSTYNAVTTDRFVADLAITLWLQRLSVNERLEELVLYAVFEALAGGVVAVVLVWLWYRGHRVDALVLLLAKAPNGFNFLLRYLYGRPRPAEDLVNVIGGPAGQSYPSGHAVLVVFLFGFLVFVLAHYTRSRRVVGVALVLFLLYASFGGLYFVHYGRHWASDVAGGYLYGLLYLLLWIKLFHLARAWEQRHPHALTMATVRRVGARLGLAPAR